ncbi:MAG: hypothetical protein LBT17_04125, partial [Mycoplasmataceae bacterium]|nr:hypothetical protein [Mycoplasmataceae bacterium]
MGGGLLTSIPFITTSCGDKLANQTISGNQTLSGGQRIAGSQEYNTTATTVATWTIAATDGSQLPNGIKMESNKLTWDDTLSYGQYSITIKCKASNYNDATYPVTLT